ncbi:MAG: hypothetical protein M3362_12910 [Acidobacteriota bacterium]|nr:hypothetical protein [Acidobacteriota bacterium]
MSSEERNTSQKGGQRGRCLNLDLYYYEQTGTGYALRITPLGLLLTLIALIVGFTILFSFAPSREKPNVNITVQPTPMGSPMKSGAAANKPQPALQTDRATNAR